MTVLNESDAPCMEKVATIGPRCTVAVAAQKMRDRHVGCLIVADDEGRMIGIVTERDIVGKLLAEGLDPCDAPVRGVMTSNVISCPVGTPIGKAQDIMAQYSIRHLPVVQNGKVVEIISSRDAMSYQRSIDKAMRAAAEQVAMLCTTFKSLDFQEVVSMAACEVPKIFGAARSLVYLPAGQGIHSSPIVCRNGCPCAERDLQLPSDSDDGAQHRPIRWRQSLCGQPRPCGQLPGVVMSLGGGLPSDSRRGLTGHLCMCGLDPQEDASEELIWYKGTLVLQILNSNLTHARLYLEERKKVETDGLTGVGSRWAFERMLKSERARALRYNHAFCMAIVDVDNFKRINDKFGHAAGDDALAKLAQCMSQHIRDSDAIARYGGDEFVLLFPETELKDAAKIMDRIRAAVNNICVGADGSISLSCGIAQLSPEELAVSTSDLFKRSDAALYAAKNAGRSRTEVWGQSLQSACNLETAETAQLKELKSQIALYLNHSRDVFIQHIWAVVRALEAKDPLLAGHSEHVVKYALGIARAMKLDEDCMGVIQRGAMAHDIGWIGLPAHIPRRGGSLTPQERRAVQQHPMIGVRLLGQAKFLDREIQTVLRHHEQLDGLGYPNGVSGDAIPLEARIVAAANAFDDLTSDQPDRKSRSVLQALEHLAHGAKLEFDSAVIEAMIGWVREVQRAKNADVTTQDLLDSVTPLAMFA